jgi:hypothetical protein
MRGRGLIVLVAGVAAAAVAAGETAAGASIGQQVTLAHGKFAHHSWSVAVHGGNHHRCAEVSLSGETSAGGAARCEPDHRPPLFGPLLSISDENATVGLELTRNRVRSMRLKVAHPRSDQPTRWTRVNSKRITRRQAHRASLKRNFRFLVLHSRGNLCVKVFVLFDRQGDRIKKRHVPCEF